MSTAPAVNMLKRVARINQPVKILEKNKMEFQTKKRMTIRESKDKLTAKQQQVLVYALKGYSNNKIAEVLGIKSITVRIHMFSVFKHFDVHTRAELSALYVCEYALEFEEKLSPCNLYAPTCWSK